MVRIVGAASVSKEDVNLLYLAQPSTQQGTDIYLIILLETVKSLKMNDILRFSSTCILKRAGIAIQELCYLFWFPKKFLLCPKSAIY